MTKIQDTVPNISRENMRLNRIKGTTQDNARVALKESEKLAMSVQSHLERPRDNRFIQGVQSALKKLNIL